MTDLIRIPSPADDTATEEDQMARLPMPCLDCCTELLPDSPIGSKDWQRYMVHDDVWADAGLRSNAGWLCIPCLETRLRRPLIGADFKHLPINYPGRDDDTDRLAALKRAAWEASMIDLHCTHHMKLDRNETAVAYNCVAAVMRGFQTAPAPWAVQALYERLDFEFRMSGFQSETECSCGREQSRPEVLLSSRQAARVLGYSKQYLNRKAETLGGVKVDGAWVFRESAIVEHIEGRDV